MFLLKGNSADTVVTDSNGVATLTGFATSDAVGAVHGTVVAAYPGGSMHNAPANGTGELVVMSSRPGEM
jgi:hypothetical protein